MKTITLVARRAVPIGTGKYEVDIGMQVSHAYPETDMAGGLPQPKIISLGVIHVHVEHRENDGEGMKDRAQALAIEQLGARLGKALWLDED